MSSPLPQSEKYHLLSDDGESESSELQHIPWTPRSASQASYGRWAFVSIISFFFIASLVGNVFFYTKRAKIFSNGTGWADLAYEVPTPIYSSTEYGPAIGTEAERDRRWEALDISEGIIAIPDSIAQKHGLPLSERFPWDQSKGVYLLGAHHQIHCLKRIYQFVSVSHQGGIPSLSYEHIVHCLDNMLQDAWCHADDTPWMQLPPEPYRQHYALYQTRQCKSFDKLMTWARKFNACYQNEDIKDASGMPSDDPFEHFKYCPKGSPHIPLMEKFFEQRARGINATEAYEMFRLPNS